MPIDNGGIRIQPYNSARQKIIWTEWIQNRLRKPEIKIIIKFTFYVVFYIQPFHTHLHEKEVRKYENSSNLPTILLINFGFGYRMIPIRKNSFQMQKTNLGVSRQEGDEL